MKFNIRKPILTTIEAGFLRTEMLNEGYWEFIKRGIIEIEMYDERKDWEMLTIESDRDVIGIL